MISPIAINISLNAISCTSVQINDCLLLALSEGLSGSVFDCRFGMNLEKWFQTPINDLSCFRVYGGVKFKTDAIFECLGRFPSESISKPKYVKLFFENLHLLPFNANPSLSSLCNTFSTVLL